MIVAYATTSDNTIGADEGISVLGFGTAFAEISEPVTMVKGVADIVTPVTKT